MSSSRSTNTTNKRGSTGSSVATPVSKKSRTTAVAAAVVKREEEEPAEPSASSTVVVTTAASASAATATTTTNSGSAAATNSNSKKKKKSQQSQSQLSLREQFIQLFSEPQCANGDGSVSNTVLKKRFGANQFPQLVPIINELSKESRLTMSKNSNTGELYYVLVSNELATKFVGLDLSARLVYQVIEKASNNGIWTKDVRLQTNIQQQALNKIFKSLENRRLIKPVKSVTAKAKKLYMLYNLTPSKELTGGVWYSDLEFDHTFISELRTFILHCLRKLNGGRGLSLEQIRDKMVRANVSKVQLQLKEIEQLVRTLVYDYMIKEVPNPNNTTNDPAGGDNDTVYYAPAKRISSSCEFKWWGDVSNNGDNLAAESGNGSGGGILSQDFHFRNITFEDGICLRAHEPHYHTS